MRIALLSDIHGNLAALEAVVADIRRHGVDGIINLGDSLSSPLLPRETAQYLMAQDWLHLAGNHERQLLTQSPAQQGTSDAYAHAQLTSAEWAWLRTLPPTFRPTPDVLYCHASPHSDCQYLLETVVHGSTRLATADEVARRLEGESAAFIACGHTHIPRVVRTASGQLIVNPGSVGLPAYDDVHPTPHWVENGSPDARYAIAQWRDYQWSASLHSVPYDHASMATLARARQRHDWAHALMTGYMPRAASSPSHPTTSKTEAACAHISTNSMNK